MGPTKSHFDRHSVDCAVIVYVKTVTKSVKNNRLLPKKKMFDSWQKRHGTKGHKWAYSRPANSHIFLNLQVWSAHCSAVAWMEKPFHVILNADKIHIHSHSHSPRTPTTNYSEVVHDKWNTKSLEWEQFECCDAWISFCQITNNFLSETTRKMLCHK